MIKADRACAERSTRFEFPQRRTRRRFVLCIEAKVVRGRQTCQPAARHRHTRATQGRSVPDGENAGHRGSAVLIRLADKVTQTGIHEALFHAKRAREACLRLEAQVQRDDIDVIAAIEPATGNVRGLHAPIAAQFLHARGPKHRHAGTFQCQQHADTIAHEAGCGTRHGPRLAPRG